MRSRGEWTLWHQCRRRAAVRRCRCSRILESRLGVGRGQRGCWSRWGKQGALSTSLLTCEDLYHVVHDGCENAAVAIGRDAQSRFLRREVLGGRWSAPREKKGGEKP